MKTSRLLELAGLSTKAESMKLMESGFAVGDDISYSATEESPPGSYYGKITKIVQGKGGPEAEVQWKDQKWPKKAGNISLHWAKKL